VTVKVIDNKTKPMGKKFKKANPQGLAHCMISEKTEETVANLLARRTEPAASRVQQPTNPEKYIPKGVPQLHNSCPPKEKKGENVLSDPISASQWTQFQQSGTRQKLRTDGSCEAVA
jgi:hypothetical protein